MLSDKANNVLNDDKLINTRDAWFDKLQSFTHNGTNFQPNRVYWD